MYTQPNYKKHNLTYQNSWFLTNRCITVDMKTKTNKCKFWYLWHSRQSVVCKCVNTESIYNQQCTKFFRLQNKLSSLTHLVKTFGECNNVGR